MNVWWLWFMQVIYCWLFVAGHPSTYFLNKKKFESLRRTVVALQKVSKFYKDNFNKVNLDSIFGLRAAEGELPCYNVTYICTDDMSLCLSMLQLIVNCPCWLYQLKHKFCS